MTSSVYCLDYETSIAPHHLPWTGGYVVSLALVGPGVTKFWLFNHQTLEVDHDSKATYEDCVSTFQKIPEGSVLVAHNLKFELTWLRHLQLPHNHLNLYCTQVAEYILNGQERVGYSLRESCRRANIPGKSDLVGKYWAGGYDTAEIPLSHLREYNVRDCRSTLGLYADQQRRLRELPETDVRKVRKLLELQFQEVAALVDMEENGMRISRGVNERNIGTYRDHVVRIDTEILKVTGRRWNLGSNDQRSALLYGGCYSVGARKWVQTPRGIKTARDTLVKYYRGMGFPTTDAVAGKKHFVYQGKEYPVYNTDRDSIRMLRATTPEQKQLLTLLDERSKVEKQLNTYLEPIQELTENTEYLHSSMMQTVTVTGRLSSRAPNLTNVTRSGTSPVKQAFVSRYED